MIILYFLFIILILHLCNTIMYYMLSCILLISWMESPRSPQRMRKNTEKARSRVHEPCKKGALGFGESRVCGLWLLATVSYLTENRKESDSSQKGCFQSRLSRDGSSTTLPFWKASYIVSPIKSEFDVFVDLERGEELSHLEKLNVVTPVLVTQPAVSLLPVRVAFPKV